MSTELSFWFTVYATKPSLNKDIIKSNINTDYTQPSIINVPNIIHPHISSSESSSDSSSNSSSCDHSSDSCSNDDDDDEETGINSDSSVSVSSIHNDTTCPSLSAEEGLPSCIEKTTSEKLDPSDNGFIADLVTQITHRAQKQELDEEALKAIKKKRRDPLDSTSRKKLVEEWYDSDDSFIDDSTAFTGNLDLMMPAIPGWFMHLGNVPVTPRMGVSEITPVPPQLTKSLSASTSSFVSTTTTTINPTKPLPNKSPNVTTNPVITCIRKKYLRMPESRCNTVPMDSLDNILNHVSPNLIDPSVMKLIRAYSKKADLTDWSKKGQFPDALKEPMWELTFLYLNTHRCPPSEVFVAALFYCMPYNMFTVRKYIATRLVDRYIQLLRIEVDNFVKDLHTMTKDLPKHLTEATAAAANRSPVDLNIPNYQPSTSLGLKRTTLPKRIKLSTIIKTQLTKITKTCILMEMLESWIEGVKQKLNQSQLLLDRMAIVKYIFGKVNACFPPDFLKVRDISLLTVWEQYAMTDDEDESTSPNGKATNISPNGIKNKNDGSKSSSGTDKSVTIIIPEPQDVPCDQKHVESRPEPTNAMDVDEPVVLPSNMSTSNSLEDIVDRSDPSSLPPGNPVKTANKLPTVSRVITSPHTPDTPEDIVAEPQYVPSSPIGTEIDIPYEFIGVPIKRTIDDHHHIANKRRAV